MIAIHRASAKVWFVERTHIVLERISIARQNSRHTKIENMGLASAVDQDIHGLKVTVDDAQAVSFVHGAGYLGK